MNTRHLNVRYLDFKPISLRVNADDQLTDVIKTIKSYYGETLPNPACFIQLTYQNNDLVNGSNIVQKLKQIPEEYYFDDEKPGTLILDVQLLVSPTSSEETISLSVQGNVVVLKRQAILSFDWMVARMLTSSVPSSKHNDMIYIDVDFTSFRIILSILQGMTDLTLEASRISTIELTLLKNTAVYLLCDNIVQEIETFETEFQTLLADRDNLASQLAEIKNSDDLKIIEAIKVLPISFMECNGFRTCRSYNKCASKTLVIGSTVCSVGDSMECAKCGSDITPRKDYAGAKKKYQIRSIVGMKSLADIIQNIND
jgi:hypothetical protein